MENRPVRTWHNKGLFFSSIQQIFIDHLLPARPQAQSKTELQSHMSTGAKQDCAHLPEGTSYINVRSWVGAGEGPVATWRDTVS